MSATGSNGNENTAGHAQAGGSAEHDAVLRALLRARRDASAPVPGLFGLDAGPEPEPDEVPLRSRGGGVNTPRAVVPTPVLAAEAVRLVDAAHTKRARMVSAIGLPAVFLAATGVAVVPTVANAASSSSSSSTAASTTCAPGSTAQANPGITGTAPSSARSSAPTSAPSSSPTSSSSSTKAGTTAKTPGAPQPSSGSTTAPAAPTSRPSSAPSGTTAPAKPSPTGVPTAPAPTSSTSTKPAAPTSTPSPSSSSSAPWWDPLGWLGTTVNGVFNPAPTSSSTSSTVNKLSAAPAANPTSDPTSSASPILSIGLGGSSSSSSPSTPPSSKPSTPAPTTPQPTSSQSKPSAPAPTSTSSSSAPTTAPSTSSSSSGAPGTITYQGKTYELPTTSCVAAATPGALREVEWHLDASSLTLTNQHFVGFQYINTGDGKSVQVMVIHADRVDVTDMVTYNEDGNTKIYSDGGKGKNVSLTNVTLHVLQQKGVMDLPIIPIPLGEVTLGPPGESGDDPTSKLVMGLLQLNLPLPPVTFKDVHVDQYTLTSDTLNIPHFNVGLNGSTPQY